MTITDQRTALLMSVRTISDLSLRASISDDPDAASLLHSLRESTLLPDGDCRVWCDGRALDFIRERAPEIARLWPAVFGEISVPRAATINEAMAMIGQTVAGLEADSRGLRLVFSSGDALVIADNGDLDWRAA